jgi:hypothetical protein
MKNKNLLWVILLVVLGIFILIILNTKEKTFRLTPFSNENLVGNRASKEYLDTIVSVGLDLLEIKGVSVLIKDMKDDIEIGDYEVEAYIIGSNKQYIIMMGSMSRDKAIEVISHELIHLQQIEKFKLIKYRDSLMWLNTIYKNPKEIPYENREWEHEAFTYGRILENEMLNKLYE